MITVTDQKNERKKYNLSFDVLDLKSFKRSAPTHGWAYIIFILKDGTTYPAVHFHNGGSKALLKELEKFVHIRRLVTLLFICDEIIMSSVSQIPKVSDYSMIIF